MSSILVSLRSNICKERSRLEVDCARARNRGATKVEFLQRAERPETREPRVGDFGFAYVQHLKFSQSSDRSQRSVWKLTFRQMQFQEPGWPGDACRVGLGYANPVDRQFAAGWSARAGARGLWH